MSGSAPEDSCNGQATVEFALILPLIAAMVALVVQMTVIVVGQLDVIDETRRATRLASLADDPPSAARASLGAASTSTIDVSYDERTVTVVVSRTVETEVPIIGRLLPDVDVRSRLVMAREPVRP